jgi:TRAP transporter TAXI family solute receptor
MRTCGRDRVCGVAGLIGLATTTSGPQDNLRLITGRQVEAGLMTATLLAASGAVAKAAERAKESSGLCVLAPLYEEVVHLVVLADSPVATIADLRGRRVCLGDDSSGGLALSQQILAAAGLQGRHISAAQLPLAQAAEALVDRRIDAFFCIEGQPSPTIRELAERTDIRLVPIATEHGAGAPASADTAIADGVYKGVSRTPTLGVPAVWAGHAGLEAELVYALTRAVWHAGNRLLRDAIAAVSASGLLRRTAGLELPFHPGAKQFYRDLGMPS